jgi:hypothetical protein
MDNTTPPIPNPILRWVSLAILALFVALGLVELWIKNYIEAATNGLIGVGIFLTTNPNISSKPWKGLTPVWRTLFVILILISLGLFIYVIATILKGQ